MQVPYKNSGSISELDGYLPKETIAMSFDILCSELAEKSIPVFDLRNFMPEYTFYRTDHHWDADAAFEATQLVRDRINELWDFDLDVDEKITDINNYKKTTYDNCFLGSMGIRTGKFYAGKDDFVLYYPEFQTDLIYRHYNTEGELTKESSGSFEEAFIDQEILDNKTFNNKYNANLYGGSIENIIINNRSNNDYKLLFISHSYGRNMVQYLSLLFAETHYLDPQPGRYEGNLIEYIDAYQPDIIICMYNDPICVE